MLAAAGAWWNDRIARNAPLQPLHPKDVQWTFSTANFPAYWSALEKGDLVSRIADDWPRPQSSLELAARLSTGIRPTPGRWQLWLGYRLAVSKTADGIGVSAYPGWLLRAADVALRVITGNRDADGVSRYGAWHYGWRDGFLVASLSRAYVVACTTHPDPSPLQCRDDGAPVFEWKGDSEGYIRLLPGEGLAVEGSIKANISDGPTPLTLSRAWPEPPALSVTARDAASLRTVGGLLADTFDQVEAWGHARQLGAIAAETWGLSWEAIPEASGAHQIAAAVLDVDTSHALPVPLIAFAIRGPGAIGTPALNVFPQIQPIAYEWNGFPGAMTPLLGARFSLYACTANDDFLVTTSEPVMSELAGQLALGPAENAEIDVVLTADWEKVANALDALAQVAGEYQLLPRMNGDDVRHTISPRLTGLSKLGTMNLAGHVTQGRIEFSGNLFQPGGDDAE